MVGDNNQSTTPTFQNAEVRTIYTSAQEQVATIRRALAENTNLTPAQRANYERLIETIRTGMDPAFLALDSRLSQMNPTDRAAAISAMNQQYSQMLGEVNVAAQGRFDGAAAFDRAMAAVQQFFGQVSTPSAPAPQMTTPAPVPTATAPGTGLDFSGMTWGRGIGMAVGALGGWLLGSIFGPGSWLSTIVSVLFAAGGAFLVGRNFGSTIDGWLGNPTAGTPNTRSTGTSPEVAPTPPGMYMYPERQFTRDDAQAIHDAGQRYFEERRREREFSRDQDNDDGSRHHHHRRREENGPGYRY